MRKKKIFIAIGVVVLILIIVLLSLRKREHSEEVSAIIAQKDNIISKVRAEGILKALNQVQIGSDVMGKIVKLKVKEGDRVRKGDVLCIVDQSIYITRLKRAEASLNLAQAKLAKVEEDLNRSKELFESQLISKGQHEEAKLNYEMTRVEAEVSMESYNEAKENLDKTVLTSPAGGEVVQLNKEEGEMVVMGTMSTPGSVIMTLAERSKMFVKALVDETEVIKIEVDQQAAVTVDALPDTTFDGKVTRIGGIPENTGLGTEEAINFPIEVEILGTSKKLYPGMSATCEITIGMRDSVIIIPYPALGRQKVGDKEQDVVFIARRGIAKQTPVKLGLIGEKGVEIRDGVNLSDTVLIGPYKTLRKLKTNDKIEVGIKKEPEVKGERRKERPKIRTRVKM